ncbi:MAG: GNAT family N-acetyltransferase [Armatimonadetes bacterium]|nr:GNAT family N-acetyltransferase [Armatimonadota bacterium]
MDIEVLDGLESLVAVRTEWDALAGASARPRPSLTYGWHRASARAFGGGDADGLFTLCFRDNGRLVGLLPLRASRKSVAGATLARDLQFAVETADCRDLVIETGAEWPVVDAFCEWLQDGPLAWDLVRLRTLCSLSPTYAFLPVLARHARLYTTVWGGDACARIHLPRSMSDYLDSMPSQRRRRTYAYCQRKLSRDHTTPRLRVVAGEAVTEEDVRRVWSLHGSGWEARGTSAAANEAFRVFLTGLVSELPPVARPVLAFLEVGDRVVTGDFGVVMDGCCFLYYGGLDPEFASYSVGHQALLALIEHGIEQGWTEIDLMGGSEPYKFHFTRCAGGTADLWVARSPGRLRAAAAMASARGYMCA